MCPVSVFDADAADQSAVSDSAVSAVRLTLTDAGASNPETPNTPDVFVEAVRLTVTSPMTNIVPVDPFVRTWRYASSAHAVLADPVAQVIGSVVARSVPATPPHRIAKVIVGVPVVDNFPKARSLKRRPSCRKFAGIVLSGKMIVSVVVFATAVPSAVSHASVSDQN